VALVLSFAAEQMFLSLHIFNRDFRSLWLMYVTGFNERHHCQACLKGKKPRRFKYDRNTIEIPAHVSFVLDEFAAPFVYLCGVTPQYEDNLHIAMRRNPSHRIDYRDHRIAVSVSHAQRLPIIPVDADKPVAFLRCRVFQFGYRYLREHAQQQLTLFDGV